MVTVDVDRLSKCRFAWLSKWMQRHVGWSARVPMRVALEHSHTFCAKNSQPLVGCADQQEVSTKKGYDEVETRRMDER